MLRPIYIILLKIKFLLVSNQNKIVNTSNHFSGKIKCFGELILKTLRYNENPKLASVFETRPSVIAFHIIEN